MLFYSFWVSDLLLFSIKPTKYILVPSEGTQQPRRHLRAPKVNGDHIFTSGSVEANAAVIKACFQSSRSVVSSKGKQLIDSCSKNTRCRQPNLLNDGKIKVCNDRGNQQALPPNPLAIGDKKL